ncbi:MAG TPA: MFS transporter [Rhizomicrobium sp.]|jgi:MFS family permease
MAIPCRKAKTLTSVPAPPDTSAVDAVSTDIPARLDRLPWSRFHWLVVTALGVTWVLDGLEVTLVGSLSGAIGGAQALHLSAREIGFAASAYIGGAVLGALFFGGLTDSLGRKRLFTVTVSVYLVATILTGASWNTWSFALFRFCTGAGIGGEYAAINSAIQEFVPARRRGVTDLIVNGSFWVGAALGALGSLVVLDPHLFAPDTGWRLAFLLGGGLALIVLWLRGFVPESPRWLLVHGRAQKAEEIVDDIEHRIARRGRTLPEIAQVPQLRIDPSFRLTIGTVAQVLFQRYPARVVLGLVLMATQAFLYNAIFFTYGLVLTRFDGVTADDVGWFILPFAVGNFLGPLLLGPLFDSWGRKPMIANTYALAGLLVIVVGVLLRWHALDAVQQTLGWTIVFFFASAGASAAYLTIGESFPLEMRALSIALFYAVGTAIGGIAGPALFGALIEAGSRNEILLGYFLGGALMLAAAATELALGISAERRSLENVAAPLSQLPS